MFLSHRDSSPTKALTQAISKEITTDLIVKFEVTVWRDVSNYMVIHLESSSKREKMLLFHKLITLMRSLLLQVLILLYLQNSKNSFLIFLININYTLETMLTLVMLF